MWGGGDRTRVTRERWVSPIRRRPLHAASDPAWHRCGALPKDPLAVHPDVTDSGRELMWLGKRGTVSHEQWIEENDVGHHARAQQTTVAQPEPARDG